MSDKASSLEQNEKYDPTQVKHIDNDAGYDSRRKMNEADIQTAVRSGSVPNISGGEREAIAIAQHGGWEIDALITEMETEDANNPKKKGIFDIDFANPKMFTWLLVAFASMGGLLSGLDQSLISGANLFLPVDLNLTSQQNSLVNSGMPLGAVGGAIILSPCNEYLGRKNSILISCLLYTIGAALEAGSINVGYASYHGLLPFLCLHVLVRHDHRCQSNSGPRCRPRGRNCAGLRRRDRRT